MRLLSKSLAWGAWLGLVTLCSGMMAVAGEIAPAKETQFLGQVEIAQAQQRPGPPKPTFFEEERKVGTLGETFLIDALDHVADPFTRDGGVIDESYNIFPSLEPDGPRSPRGPFGIFESLPSRSPSRGSSSIFESSPSRR